ASGSLLIMVDPGDSGKVIRAIEDAGVAAAKIGKIAPKSEGVKIRDRGGIRDLPRFDRDEIARILESG
ncbi:MAG TPA: hypothetical protein VH866_07525, partial [Candidatus Deferrimicrobiaceae bacterium]